jgi:hypothetical protein
MNRWSATAVFEGEFSNITTSYAGKGVVLRVVSCAAACYRGVFSEFAG